MLKIGNIIYRDELVNHTKCEYINCIPDSISTKSISWDEINIPTLMVGWKNIKESGSFDDLNILKKEYSKNSLYWEFSFKENKAQHVSGVDMFVRNVPYYYFRGQYNYTNLDPIFNNIHNLDDFSNALPSEKFNTFQYKDEMIYILDNHNIYGINMKMYEYFNFDLEELTQIIIDKGLPAKHDITGSIYQKYYKTFPFFEDLKRYLVVFLSKG